VRLDDHFEPQPDLAESWRHPDPLQWHFRLRRGVRFSDGTPLTAADAAATLNALLDPNLASPHRAGFVAVAEVTAPTPYDLIVRLSAPDASLLSRLRIGILPARRAAQPHDAHQTLGCGPYRMAAWDNGGLLLARADGGKGPAAIRFVQVKDPVTRALKLVRGEIDFTQNDLPVQLLPYLRRHGNLTLHTRSSTTFAYLGINLQDEHLRDLRLRRALALALDRAKLKQALVQDLPQLAETILTPDHWAAAPLPATRYDPATAEALLDAAGLPRGRDGVRLHLNYRTSTDPAKLQLATAIADQWRRVGIEVRIESLEWGGFYARIKRGDFQLFSLAWVGIDDPDIYRLVLHSSMVPPNGANRGRNLDPAIDALLDAAQQSETRAERRRLYGEIERIMQAGQIYIPLWYEPVIAVCGQRVRNFLPAANGSLRSLVEVQLLSR